MALSQDGCRLNDVPTSTMAGPGDRSVDTVVSGATCPFIVDKALALIQVGAPLNHFSKVCLQRLRCEDMSRETETVPCDRFRAGTMGRQPRVLLDEVGHVVLDRHIVDPWLQPRVEELA